MQPLLFKFIPYRKLYFARCNPVLNLQNRVFLFYLPELFKISKNFSDLDHFIYAFEQLRALRALRRFDNFAILNADYEAVFAQIELGFAEQIYRDRLHIF